MRVLSFHSAGQGWGLPFAAVREVLHLGRLGRPPGCPAFLEGFLHVGAESVAVVNLAVLLGLPAGPIGLYTPLILLKGRSWALLTDRLEDVVEAELRPLAEAHVLNECVEAQFAHDGRTYHLLHPDRLLLEEERLRIEELNRQHRQRVDRLEEVG